MVAENKSAFIQEIERLISGPSKAEGRSVPRDRAGHAPPCRHTRGARTRCPRKDRGKSESRLAKVTAKV